MCDIIRLMLSGMVIFAAVMAVLVAVQGFCKRVARPLCARCVRAMSGALKIRIMTHNIRYAATDLATGEAPWPRRLPLLASQFCYESRHVPECFICLQEALHHQLVDLLQHLNVPGSLDCDFLALPTHPPGSVSKSGQQEWAAIGVGRDDGKQAGEYAPILYRPAIWKVKQWGTVWLSPEPMKRGWDAASVRIVTVARFQHLASGRILVVLNTHLDDQGLEARRKGAEIILEVVKQWTQPQGSAVVLAGDLNSETDGDAYRLLSSNLSETSELCSGTTRYGDHFTFTGFGEDQEKQRLDYVFVGPRPADAIAVATTIRAQGYAVLPNRFETDKGQRVYMSDHRAVVADLIQR